MEGGRPRMNFKTKTGQPVMGQPWVFFSCHPASFSLYQERVMLDVLACCDCVFCWHDPDDDTPDELSDLDQMSLIIFAIDAKFLEEDCFANTDVWRYAIEHHIPILPLLMEDDLAIAFNERFGQLHALLGFGSARNEQLKSHFDRVFVSADKAEEIRRSFDAYLFLSYRKVDATDAADLINNIRDLDYCRDVAIWFDSYLSPGEDFDRRIREVLRASDLFVLLVTPHLIVDANNYVRREEYPEALRSKDGHILPVEMQPTDRDRLDAWYEELPPCVNGRLHPALDAALRHHLQGKAVGTNNDPRHLYCMGLAYLQGIDVEVDKQRAAKLIKEAGDAGLQDAMRTLRDMYQDGNGVRQDATESARWGELLAQSMRPESPEQASPQECLAYVRQLVEAAQAFADLRQIDHALHLLGEGVESLPACQQEPRLDLCQAKLAAATASLLVRQGKNDQALIHYERADTYFGRCANAHRESELLREWADARLGEASIVAQARHLDRGRMLAEEALPLYQESYELDPSFEAGFGYAECHYQLCDYALDRDRQDEAVIHLNACINLLRDTKARHGAGRTLDERFAWHMLAGDTAAVAQDHELALSSYQIAERVISHLKMDAMTIMENRYIQRVYAALGNTYLELDRPDEAWQYYFSGYLAASEIEADIGDLQSKSDLELFCAKLGSISLKRGELDEAEIYIGKDVSLARQIEHEASTVDTRYSLGLALCQQGELMCARRKRKQMESAYHEAYDIFDKLDDDTHGASWVNLTCQSCLDAWNRASNELKALEPGPRERTPAMHKASRVLRVAETFVALGGILSFVMPLMPNAPLVATAILIVSDLVDKLLFLGDSFLILYLLPAAIGAGIAKLLHTNVLEGAALGCCALSFALNGIRLWALLLVARARKDD